MVTITSAMQAAASSLAVVSDSAELDSEILLAKLLAVNRSYLRAWPEQELTAVQWDKLQQLLARRLQGEPVAYLVGEKEFWSLTLQVTRDTLIPRPATEQLVECCLALFPATQTIQLADLGTGCGAIALALAKERPHWQICATDNYAALAVAVANAQRLELTQVKFYQGDWCLALPNRRFNAIVSNPPYVSMGDLALDSQVSRYEPATALYATEDGLSALQLIIQQAQDYLLPGGWLLLEHGYQQAAAVAQLLAAANYTAIQCHHDLAGHPRVSMACKPLLAK